MRPFEGSTGVALTGAILHQPMAPLPARVSGTLRAILQKCLAKEPSQRYQSAAEVRAVLEMMRPDPAAAVIAAGVASDTTPRPARGRVARWVAVAALAGVVVVVAAWNLMRNRELPDRSLSRTTITLGPDESIVDEQPIAISPDGRRIAYTARQGGQQRLYVRPLDRFEATALAGTNGASRPFFSPDGRWVGFFASGKLQKVSIEGGAPVTLCDAPRGRGADWGPDDSIIFAPNGNTGLSQIPAAGGAPRILTTLNAKEGELSHRAPQILPGGKTVLFTVFTGQELTPSNRALSLVTGQTQTVVEGRSWARYVPDGHLIYVLNGVAVTVPFDHTRLTVTGPPMPVLEDLRQSLGPNGNLWSFAVSAEGSLVFVPGGPRRRSPGVLRSPRSRHASAERPARVPATPSVAGRRAARARHSRADQLRHLDLRVGARPADPVDDGRKQWLSCVESGWHPHRVRVRAIRAPQPVRAGRRWQRPRRAVGDERQGAEAQLMVARWTDAELHPGRSDAGSLDAVLRAAADDAPDGPVAGLPGELANLAGWPMAGVRVGGIRSVPRST